MHFPKVDHWPTISRDQMIEVDRLMIEDYGVSLLQMMENAGRGLATLARERFLASCPPGKSVLVLAGPGGNGGGALCAARRLAGWGAQVRVILSHGPDRLSYAVRHHLVTLQKMQVPVGTPTENIGHCDLIIDGLIGYSLKGAPRGQLATLINAANDAKSPVLALDVPSGLDVSSGKSEIPSIRAAATLTLALPKTGLMRPEARAYTGELYCADIAVPPALYAEKSLGIAAPQLFSNSDIVRLQPGRPGT